ncbi:XRE family transcriptional regulator [Weissella paramesenteroides]|uniref:XRE family transcriptional regulator n=1 Tax=Weissella paramesenteroides TaxID=1249 RepID=UPI00123C5DA0|nr:XRE family transcriptional regulator [Weissella paramesenteroides]KAA8455277.1 XRE family transcriptional regulator [Weissella paramesenteroides]KAA8456262.1 XRE family transcriptional regulator [Weissella paramesenteroides]KAA8458247.1 XRE family transcriptional regulator [Weissella paramesenteroides]KAA8460238.1 XRE family transcriptional regulator [Weissella paramesenteroides]KAA8461580.1 XRE family transcriptional regulator [Weissella paramesenteroides]
MSITFNERVRTVWKEKRPDIKSVRNLEEHIGLSNGTIASWKKSSPSQAKIEQVANFFGVSVDYLLGNTDDIHASNKSADSEPVDIKKVAENDTWDDYLSSDGRPLTEHDKKLLRAIFGD